MVEACAEIRRRARVPDRHRRARVHPLGHQAVARRRLRRGAPGRHLLGRRHLRDGQNLRLRLLLRLPVIPHGHSVHANVHLSAALPIPYVPLVEYLVKWQTLLQFFWKKPLNPVNGRVTVPDDPGMGMEVDPAKIESERELRWN